MVASFSISAGLKAKFGLVFRDFLLGIGMFLCDKHWKFRKNASPFQKTCVPFFS